jgi:uroporphyrin-III C-methyltransferase/precorrin-2 dehydrogenase/sirohydrochlorin ferrochelatase
LREERLVEHFPVFLDLKGRRAVVVGGGPEAARKAGLLRRAGADLLVVAGLIDPAMAELVRREGCRHQPGPFEPGLLDGAALVISASGNDRLDEMVAAAARERGILVNVVDRAELSGFVMPALVDRSPVVIAVSTGGTSPTLAQMVRERIEAALPPRLADLARLAGALRPEAKRTLRDPPARRHFWRRLLTGRFAALALAGAEAGARRVFAAEIARAAARPPHQLTG